MGIQQMSLAWIVVSDIQKAKKFYVESVGLKVSSETLEYGWLELVGSEGGSILGVAQTNDREIVKVGANAVVTMTVENLEQSKKEFQKRNVKMIGETIEIPGHVKMQYFQDEDGNTFQLVEQWSK